MTARPRAVVMGLGRFGGGAAVTRHLATRGWSVTVTDSATRADLRASVDALDDLELAWRLGGHDERDFERAALVVPNPAVRPDHPLLGVARRAGARIAGELELFLAEVPCRVMLVTGTQGKSSTCHLLAALLSHAGVRVHLGGNIGDSLLPRLGEMQPEDVCVVEVSSYQLEALPASAPAGGWTPMGSVVAAGVTNVLVDHLERHGSTANYAAAKARILELLPPAGAAFLPAEDARCWSWPVASGVRRVGHRAADAANTPAQARGSAPGAPGLWIDAGVFRLGDKPLASVADLRLPGRFQQANALLALGMAHGLGVAAQDLARGLANARGLAHRLEDLGVVRGHRVWDNGVSTTPDSTCAALESMTEPCTLLCGGRAKDLPLDEWSRSVAQHARRAVVFGQDAPRLAEALRRADVRLESVASVEQAVARAFETMDGDECLLFSPSCASFDAYANFRERALAFRAALASAEHDTHEVTPRAVDA